MRKAKKAAPKKTLTAAERQAARGVVFEMEEPLHDCSDRAEIVATLLRSGRLNLCEDVILELEEKLLALRASWLKEGEIHAE